MEKSCVWIEKWLAEFFRRILVDSGQGRPQGGGRGARAPPRADFGGGMAPPKNFQKFDFRGAKVSFWGGKINFEGCNSRKFFRASRESVFLRFAQKIWPPNPKSCGRPCVS